MRSRVRLASVRDRFDMQSVFLASLEMSGNSVEAGQVPRRQRMRQANCVPACAGHGTYCARAHYMPSIGGDTSPSPSPPGRRAKEPVATAPPLATGSLCLVRR